jgi:hypothetical protein
VGDENDGSTRYTVYRLRRKPGPSRGRGVVSLMSPEEERRFEVHNLSKMVSGVARDWIAEQPRFSEASGIQCDSSVCEVVDGHERCFGGSRTATPTKRQAERYSEPPTVGSSDPSSGHSSGPSGQVVGSQRGRFLFGSKKRNASVGIGCDARNQFVCCEDATRPLPGEQESVRPVG